jgi:hypothetical protein
MSASRCVPSGVPSVTQSSRPPVLVSALKTNLEDIVLLRGVAE